MLVARDDDDDDDDGQNTAVDIVVPPNDESTYNIRKDKVGTYWVCVFTEDPQHDWFEAKNDCRKKQLNYWTKGSKCDALGWFLVIPPRVLMSWTGKTAHTDYDYEISNVEGESTGDVLYSCFSGKRSAMWYQWTALPKDGKHKGLLVSFRYGKVSEKGAR